MMNRREMLKRLGLGALALTVAPILKAHASSDVPPAPSSWSSDPMAIQAAMLANYALVRGLGNRDLVDTASNYQGFFFGTLADAHAMIERHELRVNYLLISEELLQEVCESIGEIWEEVAWQKSIWGTHIIHPPMMQGRKDVIVVSTDGLDSDTLFMNLPDEEVNQRVVFTSKQLLTKADLDHLKSTWRHLDNHPWERSLSGVVHDLKGYE